MHAVGARRVSENIYHLPTVYRPSLSLIYLSTIYLSVCLSSVSTYLPTYHLPTTPTIHLPSHLEKKIINQVGKLEGINLPERKARGDSTCDSHNLSMDLELSQNPESPDGLAS